MGSSICPKLKKRTTYTKDKRWIVESEDQDDGDKKRNHKKSRDMMEYGGDEEDSKFNVILTVLTLIETRGNII